MAFWDNRTLDDDGVKDYLRKIIKDQQFDYRADGIAQLFVDPNGKPLTSKQEYRLKEAIEKIALDCCDNCGQPLSWEEMYEATNYEIDELCEECRGENDRYQNAIDKDN